MLAIATPDNKVIIAEDKELRIGLKQAITHYSEVQLYQRYAKDMGYKWFIDASRTLDSLKAASNQSPSAWEQRVHNIASWFVRNSSKNSGGSGMLYETSTMMLYDILNAFDRAVKSGESTTINCFKSPQAGATSVMSNVERVIKAYAVLEGLEIHTIMLVPNVNALESYSIQSSRQSDTLYGDCMLASASDKSRVVRLPTSGRPNIIDSELNSSCHKKNVQNRDGFFNMIFGSTGLAMSQVIRLIERGELRKGKFVLFLDEAHHASGKEQELGKILLPLMRAFRKAGRQNDIILITASATLYEFLRGNGLTLRKDDITWWITPEYCGPTVFEQRAMRVVGGDIADVKCPEIKTWDGAFDIKTKFGFESLDCTLLSSFKKFVRVHYKMEFSQLNGGFQKEAKQKFDRYKATFPKMLKYCIEKAFEQSEVVALRLFNHNTKTDSCLESLGLDKDIIILRCYGKHNIDEHGRSVTPEDMVLLRKTGCKYLIVHTGGGRMGVPFSKNCRYFLDTTTKTEHTASAIQGYFGRGCGYGKSSIYVGSEANVEHLEYFCKTGHSPKKNPCQRTVQMRAPQQVTYFWLLRQNMPNDLRTRIDNLLQVHMETALSRKGIDPKCFHEEWKEAAGKLRIQTNASVSDQLIRLIHPCWQQLENGEIVASTLQNERIVNLKPLRMAATRVEQLDILSKFKRFEGKEDDPEALSLAKKFDGYINPDHFKLAGATIGLRYGPGSLDNPACCEVATLERIGGDSGGRRFISFKGIDQQLVYDTKNGRFSVSAWKIMCIHGETAPEGDIVPNNNSTFNADNLELINSDDGDTQWDVVDYLLKSRLYAKVTKNGHITIHKGSEMNKDFVQSCPPGAQDLRRKFIERKRVIYNPQTGKYKFKTKFNCKESLFVVGCALTGNLRSATSAWKEVE